MPKEEPEFIYDDTVLEKEKLKEIVKIATRKPEKKDFNAVVLRKFVLALLEVYKEKLAKAKPKKPVPKPKIPKPEEKPAKLGAKEIKPEVKGEAKVEVPKTEAEVKPKEIQKPTEEKPQEKPKELPVAPPEEIPKPEFKKEVIIKSSTGKELALARVTEESYELLEPKLSEQEEKMLFTLKNKLKRKLTKKPELVMDMKFMEKIIKKFAKKFKLPYNQELFEKIRYYIVRDIIGYGKIDPLLKDKKVKEIYYKGLDKPVVIVYQGLEKELQTNIKFTTKEEINELIEKFFVRAKQKLSKQNNYLDTDVLGFHVKAAYDFVNAASTFEIKK